MSVEALEGSAGHQIADGKDEGNALAGGELYGHGGVVDAALLLLELHGAVEADLEVNNDLST